MKKELTRTKFENYSQLGHYKKQKLDLTVNYLYRG